jgi:hypothetical protein
VVDPEALSRDELIAVVRDQAAQLADQAVELQRLRSELEQIKRLISRNSGNSSMPPSTDDLPGRAGKRKPAAGQQPDGQKRRRGKQPGASGQRDLSRRRVEPVGDGGDRVRGAAPCPRGDGKPWDEGDPHVVRNIRVRPPRLDR